MKKVIGFTGSVNLPNADSAQFITRALAALLGAADRVYVGCALGVDALVISAMLRAGRAEDLEIFAAFGPISPPRMAARYTAPGASTPIANLSGVAAAEFSGATVHPWSGGGFDVQLRTRLAKRSLTLVEALWTDHGELFAFPARLPAVPFGPGKFPTCGSGTWSTVAAAAKLDVPVNIIALVPLADLPALPSRNGGAWQPRDPTSRIDYSWTPTQAPELSTE